MLKHFVAAYMMNERVHHFLQKEEKNLHIIYYNELPKHRNHLDIMNMYNTSSIGPYPNIISDILNVDLPS
jgi:hypothetical protein